MIRTLCILSFTFVPSIAFGQSLFFENLKNSSWVSDSSWNDSVVRKAKEIPLGKLISKDSLKQNVTIWSFNDSDLTITNYDHKNKKETEIVTYKFEIDKNKGKLKIIPTNSNTMIYRAGIAATGNYAILFRDKEKKLKKRKEIKRF